MDLARQGRVTADGLILLDDGTSVEAVPGEGLRKRGVELRESDSVLLRALPDVGWEVVRRHRFEEGRNAPFLVPVEDPEVEYLLAPGEQGWLHPEKPRLYDWYDDFDEDLPLWRRLAEEAGGPVLELACGTGRIVIDLARVGHEVTGLDYSKAMLCRAAEKLAEEPEEVRRRVEWIHADMVEWQDGRRWPLAFIGCNSLHWMGSTVEGEPLELRRRAVRTLFRHVTPGGLGVLSNVAPRERGDAPERRPAPFLMLMNAGMNPHTGRWTAEYQGHFSDGIAGVHYHGPWRFVEYLPDGRKRKIEFSAKGEPPTEYPEPLTRDETVVLMREAGFSDVQVRSARDLGPAADADRTAMFLARRT
jgi:SAM-dependent methyltransferase